MNVTDNIMSVHPQNDLECPKQDGELRHTETEPERTDQKRLPGLIRWTDKIGIGNGQEDIDTLLIIVSYC